jgi:hypothetical protein
MAGMAVWKEGKIILLLIKAFMSMAEKNKNKRITEIKGKQTIATTLRDHDNDPFVIKKVESSKKVFEKYGLPKELIND